MLGRMHWRWGRSQQSGGLNGRLSTLPKETSSLTARFRVADTQRTYSASCSEFSIPKDRKLVSSESCTFCSPDCTLRDRL